MDFDSTRTFRTSGDVRDSDISKLDRGGIWEFLWRMRDDGANVRSVMAVRGRWEKLTGRRYR